MSQKNKQKFALLKSTIDIVLIWINTLKKVFQQHHLDSMKKLAESDLKLIRKDLLKIDAPSFAIYLGSLEMQFNQEKGYHYKSLTVEAIFDK